MENGGLDFFLLFFFLDGRLFVHCGVFKMLGVSLFFIGAVLIVNGMGLAGRIEPRDAAPFNLLVGGLALFVNLLGLYRADGGSGYFTAAGGLLFAFTYLYAAAVQWYGLKGVAMGWYCGFVAVSALMFAAMETDMRMIVMWLLWSSLWLFFFIVQGLGRTLRFLPVYTVFTGIASCWIPGALMLLGRW